MSTYTLTNYPKIFKNTYWGNFPMTEGNKHLRRKEILEGRNNLIKEFGIISSYDSHKISYRDHFDHCELYKCKGGTVLLITSPYDESAKDFFIENGFQEYNKLYSTMAYTYVKEFSSKKEYDRARRKYNAGADVFDEIIEVTCIETGKPLLVVYDFKKKRHILVEDKGDRER